MPLERCCASLLYLCSGFRDDNVDDDEQFYSPYLSDLLHTDRKPASSRACRHAQNCAPAPYNEDNKDNHDNDDKEDKKSYLGYDRAFGGRRYGYRGEPLLTGKQAFQGSKN